MVSDRGTQFNNQFIRHLYELLGILPAFSSVYHLQTDRQTERINQILEDYLRMYVLHRQDDWVQWLLLAEFAYNNKKSSTTEHLPFYIWYSEHPNCKISPCKSITGESDYAHCWLDS